MYKRNGFPKKNDIVITTITRVLPHSVFVSLDEFENLEGMIHTSEMERRVVRTMKTYFKIGRELVCKIMDVDEKNRQINLSLKRVGASQAMTKEKEWKNEKRANDIIVVFSKMNNLKSEDVYSKFATPILEKYGLLFPAFSEIAKGNKEVFDGLKLDSKISEKISKLISERIVAPKVKVSGTIELRCPLPDGIEKIKEAFNLAKKSAKQKNFNFSVVYAGAPNYSIKVETEDKKQVDSYFNETLEIIKKFIIKNNGTFVKKNEIRN